MTMSQTILKRATPRPSAHPVRIPEAIPSAPARVWTQAEAPPSFAFGPFRLCIRRRSLERDGTRVALGSRALDLLELLVRRAPDVVSQSELIAHAWPNLVLCDENLRVNIAAIRRVLCDEHRDPKYVVTIWGRGYCFVAPVSRCGGDGPA